MSQVFKISAALLLLLIIGVNASAQRKPAKAKTAAKPPAAKKEPASEDARKAELDEIVKLAPEERIERLKAFIKADPASPLALRAREFLTSARAAFGDEKLRTNDRLAGAELFRRAVAEAPAEMSDKLFVEVVAQLPANLYVLGEREAARDLALAVEEKAQGNARRLLTIAAFYLSTEQPDEAARVASAAVALEPELAAAHQALGAAYRVSLRLEDAATEYARALELDPKSASARRSLADLRRATGKSEEALALYREQLAAEPQDANARAGLVLSLFDAGRREEAERELDAALAERPSNLPLLVGAAYWYAANGAGARAVELAERAVALEPRYRWVWARIALARALLAQKQPLEAERALRPARELGSFPTLDYELASILAAAGLYEEAAQELARSFTLRGGQIETNLAGRIRARGEDFNELLAPERRAGLFQYKGAEGERQARLLKSLLAFHLAAGGETFDERAATEAAREFASGEDAMRSFRHLYVAGRLLRRGAALDAVLERAEAAKGGVEAALALPLASVALFAEELGEVRARAIEQGSTTTVPNVPRDMLSKIMRGRIEELAGWALYNQGQTAEAVVRLRRAVSVLPENTIWWRSAEWRLGAALEASGNSRDALAAYVKSYLLGPDPTRRAVIEALYKKLNRGSLQGLDELLGTTPDTASVTPVAEQPSPAATTTATPEATPTPSPEATPAPETPQPEPSPTPTPEPPTPATEPTPTSTPAPTPSTTPENVEPTPTPSTTINEATTTPTPTPTPEPSTAPSPEATATPEPTPTPTPETTPTPAPSPTPAPESTPAPAGGQSAAPSSTPATTAGPKATRGRRTGNGSGDGASACTMTLSESSLTIKNNGGAALVTVNFENFNGAAPPRVSPSTTNWADIVVLAEPRADTDGNSSRFTISSTSRKTGAFVVNFNSPCGKQSVTINVE
ncbi:MAG TPA: tetratricopeptide repeat protein [Pyrinomonadaceae bacterium]|nr:tetratricopeptide repeat protein [Pyrinomonadaceae bacterium]